MLEEWRNGNAPGLNPEAVHEDGHGGSNPSSSLDVQVAEMVRHLTANQEGRRFKSGSGLLENCSNQARGSIANRRPSSDGCTGSNPVFSVCEGSVNG